MRPSGSTTATGKRRGRTRLTGQATVELAIVGTVFIMILLGTLDFGRAIFMYSVSAP